MPVGKLYEKRMGNFFFCIMKVSEERSRIRSWIRIRSKCHGSPTMLAGLQHTGVCSLEKYFLWWSGWRGADSCRGSGQAWGSLAQRETFARAPRTENGGQQVFTFSFSSRWVVPYRILYRYQLGIAIDFNSCLYVTFISYNSENKIWVFFCHILYGIRSKKH